MATEFFEAIKSGNKATVEQMLDADPALAKAKDSDGTSAILFAQYRDKSEIAKLVAARTDAIDVFEAAAIGDAARIRRLVDADPSLANAVGRDGFSPLGLAAFFRFPDIAAYLLTKRADPSTVSQNEMKVTPLHSAVANGGDSTIAKMLIEAGAEIDLPQRHGWTPLHEAALAGLTDVVEMLLVRGADPTAKNDDGMTPLDLARKKKRTEVERLLNVALSRSGPTA